MTKKERKLEEQIKQIHEDNRLWTKLFIEKSQERGKALSILYKLIDEDYLTDLLAELWDLKVFKKKLEKSKGREQT